MTDREEKEKSREEIEERTAPPGAIVYQAIYREAEHELDRDSGGLAWSGLAAGLSMGFSLIVQAILRAHTPAAEWQPLVTSFGYAAGFLIVILGRQQLFTENTLTPILPLLKEMNPKTLLNVVRLWTVVLATNLIGGFIFAWVVAYTDVVDTEVKEACLRIGRETMAHDFGSTVIRAIFAGWLLATMVWLLPFAESARFWVVIAVSYLVGLGGFSHIIAGGIDCFYLVAISEVSFISVVSSFLIPTLIGNTIGGVTLVALLAHMQFMAWGRGKEFEEE